MVRAAADVQGPALKLEPVDLAVLAAIAWQQPITRDGLRAILRREISRELTGRLRTRELIAPGPRSPVAARPTVS